MKINETNRIGAINPYRKNNDPKEIQKARRQAKDEVNISTEAKDLLVSKGQDKQRIEELRKSVSAGTYKVDARKLADKMFPFL